MIKLRSLRGLALCEALVLAAAMAAAQGAGKAGIDSIPRPAGLSAATADLTISGKVGDGSAVLLDAATVESFPAYSFTCVDPWDGKAHKYTGALLSDILRWAGIDASSSRIIVTAKNKYSIPIRRSDYEKFGYLLAWKLDDLPFADDKATRNRGTFIIAIDLDKHANLDPEVYKHQLAWQVNGIIAE
jgi:hypothetical protein